MSEENRPIVPTYMATEALIKHWRARTNRHAHAAIVTGSAAIVLSPITVSGTATVTDPPSAPDPKDLLSTPGMHTFILPVPPIAVVSFWQSLASRIANGSRELDELHWKEFEDLMAELLERSGWFITPMGYTKDGGVDIIAARTVEPGVPIEMLVQCKRYKKTHRVGVEIVKQLWATKWEKAAHQAMIAATSSFTQGARTKAKIWKMDLQDHDAILQWCQRIIM
jgi:Restriction endonuclease